MINTFKFLQRVPQLVFFNRFKQVVYAVQFKSIESMRVVSGGKYDRALYCDFFKNFKAGTVIELDICKYEIRCVMSRQPLNPIIYTGNNREEICIRQHFTK